jgi:competence protein ComEA
MLRSMRSSRLINKQVIVSLLLTAVIIAGGLIIWSRADRGQAIEITLTPEGETARNIQVTGEVNNPGIYPLDNNYNIEDILRMAGGVTDNADIDLPILYVPAQSEKSSPQKININHAEGWLLEALSGIGETRAQAIIEYRERNGIFRDTRELIKVEGIGEALYEEIKHMVTVTD